MRQKLAKISRRICYSLAFLLVVSFGASLYVGTCLPDTFFVETGSTVQLAQMPYITQRNADMQDIAVAGMAADKSYNTQLCLFGVLPVKSARAVQSERRYVVACGIPFGIKMFTDGALVVGFSNISTAFGSRNPAKTAGIDVGDVVKSVAGERVKTNDDVTAALQALEGAPAEVVYVHEGATCNTLLTAVLDTTTNTWRAGMWVRDSSAGIGTMTFYDEKSGIFAGLGHSIHDADTGTTLTLREGEVVSVQITKVERGVAGAAGELKGRFDTDGQMGTIYSNDDAGVFGLLTQRPQGILLPVAFAQEVQTGEAELLTTVTGGAPQRYTVEVEKVTLDGKDVNRNMVIRVTDKRLLEKTGGIVQGMSGSPIIQNGRIIGAVTHVLLEDPSRGYGIFAQNMLYTADALVHAA